jgi:hypothetical protein
VPKISLELIPNTRSEQQPLRLLHNGRFSLPAGSYHLQVDWSGARNGESIGLQLGRIGGAWQTWPVEPRPGTSWTTDFSLPVDVSFVGLRGTPELERIVDHVRITPTSLIDANRRPRIPDVAGASRSGPASVFYLDGNAFPEEGGFWVRASRPTRVVVHRADTSAPLVLRVHSGPIANQLQVSTPGWERRVPLQAQRREEIEGSSSRTRRIRVRSGCG